MTVDNYNDGFDSSTTEHSFPKSRLLNKIIDSIKNTPVHFINVLKNRASKNLSEVKLTQLFITQNNVQISNLKIPVYAGVEYRDVYHNSKGIPDIHYSILEEGVDHEPTFIMEAKRLPAPSKDREKEYVVGMTPSGNPSGGIQRFKLENHGGSLSECGMIAYIEDGLFSDWQAKINDWIYELIPTWSKKEKLKLIDEQEFYSHYHSLVLRKNDKMLLNHFWVYTPN